MKTICLSFAVSLLVSLSAGAADYTPAPDLPAEHWAAPALRTLAEQHGLNLRYPDGRFQGERALTRYELAALLAQVLADLKNAPLSEAAQTQLKALKTELATELAQQQQDALDDLADRQDLSETRLEQTREDFAHALARSLPFQLSGDLALRHELVSPHLTDLSAAHVNTPQTRLTLSLNSQDPDALFGYGARLSMGNLRNAANPWWRLGDFGARVDFALDRFFLVWRPASMLEITAGKFQNLLSNSELFIDTDLQPEGAMQRLHFDQLSPLIPQLSLTLAQTLFNTQPALGPHILLLSAKADTRLQLLPTLSLELSAAGHHWVGEAGLYSAATRASEKNLTAPVVGNAMTNTTGTAFSQINGAARLKWEIAEHWPLELSLDYLHNLATASQNRALQTGLRLGQARLPGEFFIGGLFKLLERDAAVSYFVEDQLDGTGLWAFEAQFGLKLQEKTTLFATWQYRDSDAGLHTLRTGIHQAF
jgi:hypothetical protein